MFHSFDENLPGRPPVKPPTEEGWSKIAVWGSGKGLTGAEGGVVDAGIDRRGKGSTGRSRRVNGSGVVAIERAGVGGGRELYNEGMGRRLGGGRGPEGVNSDPGLFTHPGKRIRIRNTAKRFFCLR
jgi:hypothetical protein